MLQSPTLGGYGYDAVVRAVAGGQLRGPTVVVPAQDVERFEREFVSLFALARQRGRHFMVVKKELEDAGLEPVFNPRKIGASFYATADLEAREIG